MLLGDATGDHLTTTASLALARNRCWRVILLYACRPSNSTARVSVWNDLLWLGLRCRLPRASGVEIIPAGRVGTVVVWLVLSDWGTYFVSVAVLYSLVSMVAAAWAFRSIEHGRIRILTSFCGGYVIGSFVGVLGTVAGAILGAFLAERSVRPITRGPVGVGGDRRD